MFVYLIKNKVNNKRYVGITTRTPKERYQDHLTTFNQPNDQSYNNVLYRAFRKYGKDNFELEWTGDYSSTIKDSIELRLLETQFIEYYRTYVGFEDCNGYNMTCGGESINLNKKKVCQYDIMALDLIKTYNSIKEASRETNINRVDIGFCCNNTTNSAGGYVWAYDGEEPCFPNYKKWKYVNQYDLNCNYIKRYLTSSHASRETGINENSIYNCCRGINHTAGNYIWTYDDCLPIAIFYDGGKSTDQYSLDGIFIQTFNSLSEAGRKFNINSHCISNWCCEKMGYAGNYRWTFAGMPLKEFKKKTTGKKVIQYSLIGEEIQTFNSLAEASRKINGDSHSIGDCCRGQIKTSGGYIWRYSIS